ncbi:MAG: TIGR00341 family protein [Phormidesmis priestleyi]|uniref:TIGR00341 family protein n=1 Tax=Phormidesmis priestleyi TaxID=268141 RepID=A0A2W4X4X0_9CYAN|nr:MAG: TIGR00341 family protein [Phormidesmis priestleyi]
MRQITVQVSPGYGKQVLQLAERHDGRCLSLTSAIGSKGNIDSVQALMPNRSVGDLLEELEKEVPLAEVSLLPSAMLSLQLPTDDIPQSLQEVQPRSSIEVFLQGVQSIGSWPSFLTYAAIAGVIVWIGLYTNSVFLLVAAMLIAPFGGPAMNVAIASARGDVRLLKRSLLRYFVALAVIVVVTWLLSMAFGQTIATQQMVSASEVSATAALLPLAGGVAGALQLVQSERSSLVSGTAIGMLVAAALAPPAGMIGMAIAINRPEMITSGIFLLLLQLVAINIACASVFRLYGLNSQGAVYARGQRRFFPIALGFSALALALLLFWQFFTTPDLLRASRAQEAASIIQTVIKNDSDISLVETNVRFSPSNIPGQNTLLSDIYVQPKNGQTLSSESVSRRLSRQIQTELLESGFDVTSLVNVTLLEPP